MFYKIVNVAKAIKWGYTVLIPTILTYFAGIYEQLGVTETIVYTMAALAYGCIIFTFVYGVYDFFTAKRFVPLNKILEKADRTGWHLIGYNNTEIVDLLCSLRESLVKGSVSCEGRLKTSDSERLMRNQPLQTIPKEHWLDYEISLDKLYKFNSNIGKLVNFVENNFYTTSYNKTLAVQNKKQENYQDLHLSGINFLWIKKAAKLHKGKSEEFEDRERKRFKALEPSPD